MPKETQIEFRIDIGPEKIPPLGSLSECIAQDLRDSYDGNFGTLEGRESIGTHFHIVRGYEERILFFSRQIIETLLCLKQTEKNGRTDIKAYVSDEIVEPILRRHREAYMRENSIGYFTIRKNPRELNITGIGFS